MQTPNPFRTLWALGYRDLLPVIPPNAKLRPKSHISSLGKSPGLLYSDGLWGGMVNWTKHVTTEADLDQWGAMGASVGLRRGQAFLLDIDAYDEATGALIEAKAIEMLGPAPCRVGQWPKRGLLYRTDEDMAISALRFVSDGGPGQIEIPFQAVVAGIHAKTGKPYQWPRAVVPFADLSLVTRDDMAAFMADMRRVLPQAEAVGGAGIDKDNINQTALRGDPDLLEDALAFLPNEGADYHGWVKMAAACRAAFEDYGRGFDAFMAWSDKADIANPTENPAKMYSGLGPRFAVGAEHILSAARKSGWTGDAMRWLEPAPGPSLFPENEGWANSGSETAASYADGKPRFDLVPFDEAAATALQASAAPLIKGLLDQGAMTVLYGESNAGKTFVAMDLAYHVARGLDWAGMKTTRLPVVYIAAEGGLGARKRAAALMKRYGGVGDWLQFLLRPVDLLRADADLKPLIAALGALGTDRRPGLIVVDTLSRAMAGGDENAPTDMGAMVRHLDVLRKATGAHVMVVHHSGKDRARGARGHSLLRAATDTEIEVADRQIAVTKQRDLDKSWSGGFDLEIVELGKDADGDPITSCVLKLASGRAVVFGVPTAKELEVVEALRALEGLAKDGAAGAELADISSYMAERHKGVTKEHVRFHLKSLLAKNLIAKVRRGRFTLAQAENSASLRAAPQDAAGAWAEQDNVSENDVLQ